MHDFSVAQVEAAGALEIVAACTPYDPHDDIATWRLMPVESISEYVHVFAVVACAALCAQTDTVSRSLVSAAAMQCRALLQMLSYPPVFRTRLRSKFWRPAGRLSAVRSCVAPSLTPGNDWWHRSSTITTAISMAFQL